LLAVVPQAPLLAAGPPAGVVVYLRPDPATQGRCSGSLTLRLIGTGSDTPTVCWHPRTEPPLRLHRLARPAADLLAVSLQTETDPATFAGALGQGKLTVECHGEVFDFQVHAFGVDEAGGRVWLSRRAELRPAGKRVVVFYRGAEGRGLTFLAFDLPGAVPVQWEALECAHPAVTVELLHAGLARPVARARLWWDPRWLGQDEGTEDVVFRLRPCGLAAVQFRQRVLWRLRHPLRCRPPMLAVPCLDSDRPAVHWVRVTNEDRQSITVQDLAADVPWVTGMLPGGQPLSLDPGAEATLRLEFHPQALNGAAPPHLGVVTAVLRNRGHQSYPVRIETVQGPRALEAPLFVDPGPPRIVLARWDSVKRRMAYITGDGGLEPEELGLSREEYARATLGEGSAESVLRSLVAAVRTHCQLRERLAVSRVRVWRRPWVPALGDLADVELQDWAAAWRSHGESPEYPVIWVEPSGVHRLAETDLTAVPLPELTRPETTLGGCLALRLAAHLSPAPKTGWWATLLRQPRARSRGRRPDAWVRLASDRLLADHHWGPEYAWRRWLDLWRQRSPVTRFTLGPREAGCLVRATVAEYARSVCAALARDQRQRAGAPGWLWVSSLFRGDWFAELLQSAAEAAGLRTHCVPLSWVDCLSTLVTPADRLS
jgi:hypothetical protein